MKYLSLFSGIGGFELGINNAYDYQYTKGVQQGFNNGNLPNPRQPLMAPEPLCVGYSEIDPHAIRIYQSHFPTHHNYGDITKIDPAALPDFDLLVGGFPCQAFSIAGKRLGFADTRGTLFFDIARILQAKKPRFLVLENVKGLLSHDNGRTFKTIIQTLTELGYDLQWQVVNSKDYGVPQNRERVFIVGHLRGESRPEVFPLSGSGRQAEREMASTAIDANYWKGIDNHGARTAIVTHYGHTDKEPRLSDISPTLKAQSHGHKPMIAKTVRSGGRGSPHGSKQNWDSYEFEGRIHRITPTECERLQGFPDGWTAGVSDTQRYKCLGNAVTVNVVQAIMERLMGKLDG